MANLTLLLICFFLTLSSHLLDGVAASQRNPKSPRKDIFTRANNVNTVYYFDQRVNHKTMSSGKKFKQRYWLNLKHYNDGTLTFITFHTI